MTCFFRSRPLTPALSPQAGRGSAPFDPLAPRERGEGGTQPPPTLPRVRGREWVGVGSG